jgi:hypothetical protein
LRNVLLHYRWSLDWIRRRRKKLVQGDRHKKRSSWRQFDQGEATDVDDRRQRDVHSEVGSRGPTRESTGRIDRSLTYHIRDRFKPEQSTSTTSKRIDRRRLQGIDQRRDRSSGEHRPYRGTNKASTSTALAIEALITARTEREATVGRDRSDRSLH